MGKRQTYPPLAGVARSAGGGQSTIQFVLCSFSLSSYICGRDWLAPQRAIKRETGVNPVLFP